jgi:hypothetical protein
MLIFATHGTGIESPMGWDMAISYYSCHKNAGPKLSGLIKLLVYAHTSVGYPGATDSGVASWAELGIRLGPNLSTWLSSYLDQTTGWAWSSHSDSQNTEGAKQRHGLLPRLRHNTSTTSVSKFPRVIPAHCVEIHTLSLPGESTKSHGWGGGKNNSSPATRRARHPPNSGSQVSVSTLLRYSTSRKQQWCMHTTGYLTLRPIKLLLPTPPSQDRKSIL